MEIFAHRGASAHAPENTMAAFVAAYDQRADAIELDVHVAADGTIVVIHDDTVQRTTQGTGAVAQLTYDQLRRLDAGSTFGASFRGERIPTLAEVLDFVRSTSMRVNIEVKGANLSEERLLQLIRDHDMIERTIVSSFSWNVLRKMQAVESGVQVAPLCTEFHVLTPDEAYARGFQAIHPHLRSLSPMYIRRAIDLGVSLRPYTVNRTEDVSALFRLGTHAIITDDPLRARRIVQQMRSGDRR